MHQVVDCVCELISKLTVLLSLPVEKRHVLWQTATEDLRHQRLASKCVVNLGCLSLLFLMHVLSQKKGR